MGQYNSNGTTLSGVPANSTAWTGPVAASVFQDIRSDNWNGSTPPTYGSPGTYGTSGYYISQSTGNVYFNNGVFRGDISGGSNINITGNAVFDGAYSSSGSTYAVVANASYSANGGVIGYASGFLQAAIRGEGSGSAIAGLFQNSGSQAALQGYSSGTGNGLYVAGGTMAINNNTLVSNLHAQYANTLIGSTGANQLTFNQGTLAGSSTATFNPANKPASSSTNGWIQITIDSTVLYIPVWT
jgi:hypothetical protein